MASEDERGVLHTISVLRDCLATPSLEELSDAVVNSFTVPSSPFRLYRHIDGRDQTIARLMTTEDLESVRPRNRALFPSVVEAGTLDFGGRIHGKTSYNRAWSLTAAYVPDLSRWSLNLLEGNHVLATSASRVPESTVNLGWSLMDLHVALQAWDLVGYRELVMRSPGWEASGYGVAEGLAEDYMQDLLVKTIELSEVFQPSFAHAGQSPGGYYGLDFGEGNPHETIRVEKGIPQISWANIFGPSYVEKYGWRFLLDAPGYRTEALSDGSILYQVTEHFFLTEEDLRRGPKPKEVERHFRRDSESRRMAYQPVMLRDFVSNSGRTTASTRQGPPSAPPKISQWADSAVSTFKDRFGLSLDYSPASLKIMDKAISKYFPKGEEPLPTTLLPLGAYLGEVLRRNLGGEWRLEDPIFDSFLVISGQKEKAEPYPFRRVAKRFVEGKGASLESWYAAAARSGGR